MPNPSKERMLKVDSNYLKEQTLMLNKVVTGLAMLQDAIQTLSSTYIQHTNSFLGEQAAGHDVASVLSRLGDNPLVGSLQNLARAASVPPPAGEPAGSDKKERKKRMHDPNAPKRPLTPFFLYMQTARPIISNDLGAEVPKGAVSQEGTRRWGTMALDDKQVRLTRAHPYLHFHFQYLTMSTAMVQCIQRESPSLQCSHALLQDWKEPRCQGYD